MDGTRFEIEVKNKGRLVLPAALRATCGFEPGTRLIVRQVGPGQALVETSDAVLERIWAHAPGETEGVEALRRWRDDEAGNRRPPRQSDGPDAVGAATLAALGLD